MCPGIEWILSTTKIIGCIVDAEYFVFIDPIISKDNHILLHQGERHFITLPFMTK